jgi:hypothetical protein
MSQNKFLLNNNLENYLIHGQLLSYRYEIPNAWFVIIKYENQLVHNSERVKWFKKRYYIKKNKGIFENYTNAYSPKITFYCFGFGIWKIVKNFKVNFVNVKLPDLEIKEAPVKLNTIFTIKKSSLYFEINKKIFSKTFFTKNIFLIKNKECKIIAYNDYKEYKQNYKTN